MRIPMVEIEALAPELKAMLAKWEADGGDPDFIRPSVGREGPVT